MPMKPRYGNPLPKSARPRPSAFSRGYDYAWLKIARQHLKDFPSCALCGDLATSVDHVQPLRVGGTHDRWNRQSLCQPCHSTKTHADKKRWP